MINLKTEIKRKVDIAFNMVLSESGHEWSFDDISRCRNLIMTALDNTIEDETESLRSSYDRYMANIVDPGIIAYERQVLDGKIKSFNV